MVVKVTVVRKVVHLPPCRFPKLLDGPDRLKLAFRNDPHEASVAYELHDPRHALHRCLINRGEYSWTIKARPQNARMKHTWQSSIMKISWLTHHFRGDIDAL